MRRTLLRTMLLAAAIAPCVVSMGQTVVPKRVVSARIGENGRVYLRWSGGPERVQPAGEAQAVVEGLTVSEEKLAVGWLVGRQDLSDASYPEPFEVMVAYGGGRAHSLSPGRVIGEWVFEGAGKRVATWDETAHGGRLGKATLFDSRTGRRVATWSAESHTPAPEWALPLKDSWKDDVGQ